MSRGNVKYLENIFLTIGNSFGIFLCMDTTRERVKRLLKARPGLSGAAIARLLEVSRQRVSQIVKAEQLTLKPTSAVIAASLPRVRVAKAEAC